MGGWLDRETHARAKDKQKLPPVSTRLQLFVPGKLILCREHGKGEMTGCAGVVSRFCGRSLFHHSLVLRTYLDAPGSTGLLVTDTNLLHRWVLAADHAGLQVAVHAIGDRATTSS